MRLQFRVVILATLTLNLLACSGMEPLKTVERVDIDRFMGDWYVIANIPTFIEKGAHNAIESYRLDDDGTIDTTFTFRKGGFDGDLKQYNPRGFIVDEQTNAEWGMQFIWPIKADYRIIYLDDDYRTTVIGRNKRDYVWIMARTPSIPTSDYDSIIKHIRKQGYDISKIRPVPQRKGKDEVMQP